MVSGIGGWSSEGGDRSGGSGIAGTASLAAASVAWENRDAWSLE